jgi:hypothetical protein
MPRNDLKAYTTVLARIPHDLADAVKRSASLHRCTVSELIRDGLEMRLEAEIPGRSTGHHGDTGEHGNEVLREVLQAIQALLPMGQAAIRQTISEVLHEVLPQYVGRQQGQQQGITEVIPIVPTILRPATEDGHTEVLPGHTELPQPDTQSMPAVLPLEASPPGHDEEEPAPGSEPRTGLDMIQGHTEVLQGMTKVLPDESKEALHDSGGMTEVLPQKTPGQAREHKRLF